MLIFDVTDPDDPGYPVELRSVMLDGVVRNIAVHGDYAYVGAPPGRFSVVDVSNLSDPVLISMGNTPDILMAGYFLREILSLIAL